MSWKLNTAGLCLISTSACLIAVFFSCKKYQATDSTFFVKAKNITVDTQAFQGSQSHNITDFWLYVNDNFQGAYPIGNLMPIVTKNEKVNIKLFAGIKKDGINGTRIPWLFYKTLEFDTLIENGLTIERPVTFVYNPLVKFAWVEDFNTGIGITLKESAISDTVRSNFIACPKEEAFEGNSFELSLKPDGVVAQIESAKSYTMPPATANVYLELNYKGNEQFDIGFIGSSTELKPIITVNPKTEWNKIYVSLAFAVNSEPVSSSYTIYFRMVHVQTTDSKIYLDNIKLVYIE